MDTNTDALDRADMARLASGQDAALSALMDRHAAPVFRFLCRMLGNEDDANDLAQETFVRVHQAREKFNPGQKFTSWLYTIAANLARNQLRWRSRHPNVPLDTAPGAPEPSPAPGAVRSIATPYQAAVSIERARAVRDAVGSLPDDLREAIVLCEWEDMAVSEAAEVLNTTSKAVESRLYRARQQLREKLKSWL